jgi:hypothetical protein
MKMVRMPLSLSEQLREWLKAKRQGGTTSAGYIRSLLERERAAEVSNRKRRSTR